MCGIRIDMKKALMVCIIIILFTCFLSINLSGLEDTTVSENTTTLENTTQEETTVSESTTALENTTQAETTQDTSENNTSNSDEANSESTELLTLPDQANDDDDEFSFGSINWGVYIILSVVASMIIAAIIILANPTDRKK